MPVDILVVRHIQFEHAGSLAPVLERSGHRLIYSEIGNSPNLEGFAALILMGGPMSVNDSAPWVEAECELIRAAISCGKPVLGICLGAQLIARALGAEVRKSAAREIGWYPVRWLAAAGSDPLFTGLPNPATVFHWHGETFDLPPGSVCLAESDLCSQQAFRHGHNVYGLQFHLEVTPAMVGDWLQQDINCGDAREIRGPIDPNAHAMSQSALAHKVFSRWEKKFLHP